MQFAKPENALKRAEELISIDAKGEALQVLHSIITSKKFRNNWQPILEKLMLKYISLAVEQRKGRVAKDGLHQYRVICQANLSSLEVVVKHFLSEANERAKEAQSKADKIILDIEDLEAEESMESLILGSVSGEDSKDRTDREVVTPWLKFLWETYRTVLEVLRNNTNFEQVYQDTAQQAFKFCLRYKRNTEFRRLSELLRTHLANVTKQTSNQISAIKLSSPESLQLHLDTRFAQLAAATELELWQEAFRSVEDIHGLVSLSKKAPKPSVMIDYFQRLSQIFWVSDNHLFHAAAMHRYFALVKAHNKPSGEELGVMASVVLLATMSIPKGDFESAYEFDSQLERNYRLANLLTFGAVSIPKREQLVEELTSRGILNQVIPELSDFYTLMEKKFNPLQFINSMKPKLEFIANHASLKQYAKPLQNLLFVRLLQQLSRVYETIKITEFLKLASFVNFHEIEKSIVDAVKGKYVDVRVDHQNGVLNFKTQTLEGERLRDQLARLAKNLHTSLEMIQPDRVEAQQKVKESFFSRVLEELEQEHQQVIGRKVLIEKRKEDEEIRRRQRQAAEEERRRKAAKAKEEEDIAYQELVARRAREAKEAQELRDKNQREIEQWLMQSGEEADPKKVQEIMDSMEGPGDIQAYIQKRIDEHEKEKKKLHQKLKRTKKEVDYFERARREEELSLLEEQQVRLQQEDRDRYETTKTEFLKAHREAHERSVAEKRRLTKMEPFRAAFEAQLSQRRQEDYAKLKRERDERLAVKKAQLLREKEERERADEERRQEMERRLEEQEEEDRKLQEEEEMKRQREEESMARRRQQQEAEQSKLQEQAALQQQREEEAMSRRHQREEPPSRPDPFGRAPEREGYERGPDRFERGPPRRFDRGPDRGYERGPDRGYERGPDRGLDRGPDRGYERGPDRGFERGPDRGFERGPDRGYERGPDRGFERGPERRFDRGPDRGLDRGPDRGLDRGPDRGFERGPERRFDRGPDRGYERGPDRGFGRGGDRGYERGPERGYDRGPDRSFERGPERGFDRAPDRGFGRGGDRGFERGPERGYDRGHDRGFEKGADRGDRFRGRPSEGEPRPSEAESSNDTSDDGFQTVRRKKH